MLYTVICRGGLDFGKGVVKPTGSTVEISSKEADSLPPGTVELVQPTGQNAAPVKPEPKPTPKTEAKASKDSK